MTFAFLGRRYGCACGYECERERGRRITVLLASVTLYFIVGLGLILGLGKAGSWIPSLMILASVFLFLFRLSSLVPFFLLFLVFMIMIRLTMMITTTTTTTTSDENAG